MNRFFVLLLALLFSFGAKAQVDSIHFQFQDTILKAGTTHTFLMTVRENIQDALGFQFCLQFDPQNIGFKSIPKYYISGWTEDNMNIYPLGHPDYIACAVDVITTPYTGKKLVELQFDVFHDCRVKDVIRILTAYRFKEGDPYNMSEVFFENDSYPIATEYLPFKVSANNNLVTEKVEAYPNPSSDDVFMNFTSNIFGKFPVTFMDNAGKTVGEMMVEVKPGANKLVFNKRNFGASGNYFIRLNLGSKIITSRVTIVD